MKFENVIVNHESWLVKLNPENKKIIQLLLKF